VIDTSLNAVYFHAEHVCSSFTSLIIEDDIHDTFVEALKKRVENIVLGDGMDDNTEMGPLISKEHLDKVTAYVENGRQESATDLVGGNQKKDANLQNSRCKSPTVRTNYTRDMQ